MITGYQGNFIPGKQVNLPIGNTTEAIDLKGFRLVGIRMPTLFTGTTLTFFACDTIDGAYLPIKDSTGAAVSVTVAQATYVAIDPKNFEGIEFLKIQSGSTESVARVLSLALRG